MIHPMTIDELINALAQIRQKHGNISIVLDGEPLVTVMVSHNKKHNIKAVVLSKVMPVNAPKT